MRIQLECRLMKKTPSQSLKATTCELLACVLISSLLISSVLMPSLCSASTLFYLTTNGAGQGASPVSPQEILKFLPGGGSFHIWVQPDALFNGISLDVQKTGSAIRFTGATVHNPTVGTDTRWLPGLIRNGTVTDSTVSRIEGGALTPLAGFGTGIGPTTSSSDLLYETNGGFLFATIDFAVPSPTETATVSLSIGHNLLSDSTGVASGSIFFGVGDGPVANTAGASGTTVDLNFVARPLHPADFDSDGDVDGADMLTWQNGFGITSGATRTQGDANGDGKVDSDDLGLWESQFGTVPAGAAIAVPETTSVFLAICGTLFGIAIFDRQ